MQNESAVTCDATRLRSPVVDHLRAVLAAVAVVIGGVGGSLFQPSSSASAEARSEFSSGLAVGSTVTVQFDRTPRETVIVPPRIDPSTRSPSPNTRRRRGVHVKRGL